ncbi:MAG: RNA polymerase sigma factor [Actinobacteria bacterium]|nr:MAG: RNA polymerase sigma factor [Actinomycetota bacterium]
MGPPPAVTYYPRVTSSALRRSELTMPTDVAELVAAAKEGDRSAFDELVRQTYAETYTLAYRLTGNEEDARDVAQDAYLRAFRGLNRFRGDAQFSTWLYRITANCAATFMGKRARNRHEALDEDTPLEDERPEVDPERRAHSLDLRDQLGAAISELPPKLRAVVVLRDIYDLPHEDIAAELGISVAAAKVRLHRARHKLRSTLFPEIDEVEARAV